MNVQHNGCFELRATIYSFNDCYWLLYNRYTQCGSRENIPVESVSDSSHILINSLRYNVISSNLMKIRSLLRFKILIIIKIQRSLLLQNLYSCIQQSGIYVSVFRDLYAVHIIGIVPWYSLY